MRDLKFRAQMIERTSGHDDIWAYIKGVGHDQWHSKNGRYYGAVDYKTLGEYVGLQDKNDTDIYEGDICLKHYGGSLAPRMFKVVIEKHAAGLYFIPPELQHPDDVGFKTFWNYDDNEMNFFYKIEVIGNVHQNPELLSTGVDLKSDWLLVTGKTKGFTNHQSLITNHS